MKIEKASAADVRRVAAGAREQDRAELLATSSVEDFPELIERLGACYGGRDDVMCGFADNWPVCIGGTIEMWPGVMSLLFFATPRFSQIGLGMTRWIKRELFPRYFEANIHRIQAISMSSHVEAHAWLRTLGMEQEAILPKFGRNGENFLQFAAVR